MPIADFAVTRRVTVAMIACHRRARYLRDPAAGGCLASQLPAAGRLRHDQLRRTSRRRRWNRRSPGRSRTPSAASRASTILQSDSYQGQSVVTRAASSSAPTSTSPRPISSSRSPASQSSSAERPEPLSSRRSSSKIRSRSRSSSRLRHRTRGRTLRDLSDLFTNQLSDEFSAVAGVATVSLVGGPTRAIMVEPSSIGARARTGSTLDQVDQRRSRTENIDAAGRHHRRSGNARIQDPLERALQDRAGDRQHRGCDQERRARLPARRRAGVGRRSRSSASFHAARRHVAGMRLRRHRPARRERGRRGQRRLREDRRAQEALSRR